jgi:hypothetical protein
MMVHCRFRNPDDWRFYKSVIHRGGRYAPCYKRDIGGFRARHMSGRQPAPDEQGSSPQPNVLDQIDNLQTRIAVPSARQ